MKTFLRGTLLLTIAAFIGECIEFFINMILARELQESGMGHYMSILPIIYFLAIIASFELPISISKYVAENKSVYHKQFLTYSLKIAFMVSVIISGLAMVVLSNLSFMTFYHPHTIWLLIVMIPLLSFSSVARGYFMGTHQMGKIAFANGSRKAFQLILLLLLFQTLIKNQQHALLMALAAFVVSEVMMVVYLMVAFYLQMKGLKQKQSHSHSSSFIQKQLFSISIPTTGLRLFHSFTHVLQPFLIKISLVNAGYTKIAANEHFGLLSGVAISIGFFPAFIAHSLLVALIPSVSEAKAKNDQVMLINLLRRVCVITLGYGIPAIFIIYWFAEPLTYLFFDSTSAVQYLILLLPYFFFHYLVVPLQAYLIGLHLIKPAFMQTVWSHLVMFILMYLLGSQSEWHMTGVILSMNIGAVVQFLLHYFTICKKIGFSFRKHILIN
ncbi:oligosaccharide flippase family protein [Bacillus carboniphilus]|uniref:Oligosaccharide flippase family protein n=1 Tax=Bacillus carboniphilus TaxID=86663 RepID=A0ABY9JWH7_9BACI|nr:oligosaccharide flippase family protein [Bacillus carboniphilus]WLR43154.1 oligosaccharide flippase family protein [Bacillus carboniphilus]